MKLTKPIYFDTFRCIASDCPDSCCKEWDVHVDPDKAVLYRSLPGALGDRLREVLYDEDGEVFMSIVDRRCPMWRTDGLCRIQAELGESALCKTCREFPRLTHDYGNFVEMGLELSCPEAARLILAHPTPAYTSQDISGGEEPEYDTEAMEILLRTREVFRKLLSDSARPVNEVLTLALMYGYQAQSELDGADAMPFDPDAALAEARNFAVPGEIQPMLDFFGNLEILTPAWRIRLDAPCPAPWQPAHLTIARYFADRYWLQAVSDYDLISRVKLAVISCLLIRTLGGNLAETAQLYSKEIENSIDNVESLLDGTYCSPVLTDNRLLGLLLL